MGVTSGRRASRLLIISGGAGNVTHEIAAKLRALFADHLIISFDPKQDFDKLITPRARVVIAGGDGSVEFVIRKLADSKHPVGILSLGPSTTSRAHSACRPISTSRFRSSRKVGLVGSPWAV